MIDLKKLRKQFDKVFENPKDLKKWWSDKDITTVIPPPPDMNSGKITMYIIKYWEGSYYETYETPIFVTFDKLTAINYVNKFNRILNKWKKHYSQYEDKTSWLKKEYDEFFERWYDLKETEECCYKEIEIR